MRFYQHALTFTVYCFQLAVATLPMHIATVISGVVLEIIDPYIIYENHMGMSLGIVIDLLSTTWTAISTLWVSVFAPCFKNE